MKFVYHSTCQRDNNGIHTIFSLVRNEERVRRNVALSHTGMIVLPVNVTIFQMVLFDHNPVDNPQS